MWTSGGEWRQKATHILTRPKTQKSNEKGTVLMGVDRDREGGRDGGRATAWRASGGDISCTGVRGRGR
jgi:hypothetical protein